MKQKQKRAKLTGCPKCGHSYGKTFGLVMCPNCGHVPNLFGPKIRPVSVREMRDNDYRREASAAPRSTLRGKP